MKDFNQQEFNLLRKIHKKPNARSKRTCFRVKRKNLGKLNYVLKELKKKGLVKINNFKNNPNKSGYLYLLTPKGISEKTKVTIKFMQRKMHEYEELKNELEKINKNKIFLTHCIIAKSCKIKKSNE